MNSQVKNKNTILAFLIFIILMLPSITLAGSSSTLQEPNRNICNPLKAPGITSGLYGLCVAACEALDCTTDPINPTANHPQCEKPSSKIIERYNKMKKSTDPEMPCVVPPPTACPCWSQQELNQVGVTWLGDPSQYMPLWNQIYDASYGLWEYYTSGYHGAGVSYLPEPGCHYFHYDAYDPVFSNPVVRVMQVSQQVAQACQAQVSSQIDYLRNVMGLTVTCLGDACTQ